MYMFSKISNNKSYLVTQTKRGVAFFERDASKYDQGEASQELARLDRQTEPTVLRENYLALVWDDFRFKRVILTWR